LEWLGEEKAARAIQGACERALAAAALTPDMGGKLKTDQITQSVVQAIAA
jgi:isocitrate/isopropylmalate dehydrogenase